MKESTKLIYKKFRFGEESFKDWHAKNSDVQHLELLGRWSESDYNEFKEIDILDPKRGLIVLDMSQCQTDFCFWDYYYGWDGCCKRILFPEGINCMHINTEFFNSFEEVVLPSTIEVIGGFSFSYCELKKIVLPEGLKELYYQAFSNNPLEIVNIPDSCTYIEDSVFCGCYDLKSISVNDTHPTYKTINGSLYSKDGKELIHAAPGVEHLIIANGTRKICEDALSCIAAKKITFPSSIKEFDNYTGGITYDDFGTYHCEEIYVHKECYEVLEPYINFELNHPHIENKPKVHIIE